MLHLLAYALLGSQPILASPINARWTQDQCSNSPLRALAQANSDRYFGTAFQTFYAADDRYTSILDTQFNQFTPENEMKWEVIQPQRGVFNWTGSDLVIAKAKEVGGIVRGHNFCWDQQTPSYVTNITDPDELKSVLREHIDAVLGRYKDDLYAMDIINEPLNDNGTIKASVWYDVLGEDYLATCLQYARDAAPDLKLYINDYNIESVNNKSIALANIVKGFLANGVPIDGVGFESHFIGGSVPKDLQASMKQFTDQGLDVAITELDVRVPVNNAGIANSTWLQIQADDYSTVIQACLDNGNCPGVTIWEFTDAISWIPGVFAGQGAACPYGLEYEVKPALGSIASTLAQGFSCGNGGR
ncbi:hypothetical protein IAU59_004935 [Kwoniella sp. CBS 9459]